MAGYFKGTGHAGVWAELAGPNGPPTGRFFVDGCARPFFKLSDALDFQAEEAALTTPPLPDDQTRAKRGRSR